MNRAGALVDGRMKASAYGRRCLLRVAAFRIVSRLMSDDLLVDGSAA